MTDDGAFNCPYCDVMCEPLDITLLVFPDDSGELLYKQSLNLVCPQCGRRFAEILGEDVVLEEVMEEDDCDDMFIPEGFRWKPYPSVFLISSGIIPEFPATV